MKVLCQALRAATIETLGVALIIVLLFGLPAWSLQGSVPGGDFLKSWLQAFQNRAFAAQPHADARHDYAARRLGYYSRAYGQAASQYVEQIAQDVVRGPRG